MSAKGMLTVFMAVFTLVWIAPGPAAAWIPAIREVFPGGLEGAGDELRPPGEPGRVVIVTVDYLQVRDLEGKLPPNLSRLAAGGAAALMNVNTGGSITPENAHATIGSGSHMVATDSSACVRADEKLAGVTAAEEYQRRTARKPPAGSLLCLDIARIYLKNKEFNYTVSPGALGKKVHDAGFRTAALGDSDGPGGPKRQIILMAMDEWGIVDTGLVGTGVVRPEKEFPGGFSADYNFIIENYARLSSDVRLVAIDPGDLSRLQAAREYTTGEHWMAWRSEAIRRLDDFLGSLVDHMDTKKDLLVLVSPAPGDDGLERDRMSPVLIYGGGSCGGLLVSPTTRRPGIIMNIDIAPTVLHFLGIAPPEFLAGRPARVIPGAFNLKELAGMYRVLDLTYQARPYLHKGYVLFQLVLLAVSLCFIFLRKGGKEILKPFFLAVMSVPLVYLMMPLFPAAGILAMTAELIIITAAVTLITIFFHRRFGTDPFLLICVATATAIAVDLAAGSPLQKASVLGFDPIVGARFYGLGNEYMGVLIGSTLIGTTALVSAAEKRRGLAIAACGAAYLAILYLIGAPQLGTNVGGTIAAGSAFLVVFLLLCGVRFTWPMVLAVAAGVGLMVLALVIYDAGRPAGHQSHIGRTAGLILSGGLDQVTAVISRKSEMNLRLFRYTVWSRVLLASLGMLALLFYRPVGVMEGIKNRYPYLFRGLVGVVVGSVAALLFNDSGVVAAATVMVFGAPPLVYLVLDRLET